GALDKRGTLYILAIGVDKYPGLGNTCGFRSNESCDLRYSGADARAFAAAIEKRLRPEHDKVVERLLVNGAGSKDEPTAATILNAVDMLKRAEETDTVLVFFSGRVLNEGLSSRSLPPDGGGADGVRRGAPVVPWYALQGAVDAAKGGRILFIDPCH